MLCFQPKLLYERLMMDHNMGEKEYLSALEEERRKIETFQKELPLSLHIVTETIETLRKQIEKQEKAIAEEVIPINLNISYSENDEIEEDKSDNNNNNKRDWSHSLQLWSQESEKEKSTTDKRPEEAIFETDRCMDEEGFSNDQEDNQRKIESNEKEEQKCEAQKKTRRCWSQELHRRFVHALEQLGGAHVATPKHIRELMKVDGLTNDEVKSHLQKYRLHTKKPSSRVRNSNNNDYAAQAPQFVLVGAWVPPADRTGSEESGCPANIIHSSLVSLPSHLILPHHNRKMNLHGSPTGPQQKSPTRDSSSKSASSHTTNASF
ncbi:myb-like transcription factor family protein [Rhynchospora pubera]|uniref:Myb-like transcription factor family protein n=1 Tax=Rhynchospora pubera TaxID=906938 RepID=A0AAV8EJZ5_9POAL|nr:myb-like transcription factor family protein [Rhynchospora pubera]